MVELSETAKAALILHGAQKTVSARPDGAVWIIEERKWALIGSLPAGPEHTFILALIRAECERKYGA